MAVELEHDDKNVLSKSNTINVKLITVFIATTLGTSVPVGFHLGVVNAPADFIKPWCNETIYMNYNASLTESDLEIVWASVVSIYLVGGVIGSLIGAWISNTFGRKRSLLAGSTLYVIGALLFLFCRQVSSIEMLFGGRLIVGLGSGVTTSTGPMYLSEISPLRLRGSAGTLLSLGVVGGIFLGQIFTLPQLLGSEHLWEYALSVYAVWVLLCLIPYPYFPESPKYLYIIAGKKDKAVLELNNLRNNDTKVIEQEIGLMQKEVDQLAEKRSIWSVLTDRTLALPVLLVCALQGGHQLSGVNAVIYYSVSMFALAGVSLKNAKWINLGIGLVAFTVASCTPIIMAKINRRPLILFSCFCSATFLTILTLSIWFIDKAEWLTYASIAAIFGFILTFELGLGALPYFIASELFESATRPSAMAIGSIVCWVCNIIVGMTFPILRLAWGAGVFIPFVICCYSLAIFLKFYLPETRGFDSSQTTLLINKGLKSKPLRTYTT